MWKCPYFNLLFFFPTSALLFQKLCQHIGCQPSQVQSYWQLNFIKALLASTEICANQLDHHAIFTHATSWKNCSTVLPGSPICNIFHDIKRLCLEWQNSLTVTRVWAITREAIAALENPNISWPYLLRINASKLADQGWKYKIQPSPAKKITMKDWIPTWLSSVHPHYTWMLINSNGPEGCRRRTRSRSTTWSGLMAQVLSKLHVCSYSVQSIT